MYLILLVVNENKNMEVNKNSLLFVQLKQAVDFKFGWQVGKIFK